jgi:ABC-type transport system involved in multi-copper enzyme maturation permease subunit
MKGRYPGWPTVAASLVRWEAARSLLSLANYAGVFVSLSMAFVILNSRLGAARQNGLLVTEDPFILPFLAALLPYATFLALAAGVSLAREMESRMMEVLFYSPVGYSSYVVGRFLGQLTYYLVALPLVALFFFGYARSTNLRIGSSLLAAMALSPFTVAGAVAFGILLASCLRRARLTAVVLVAMVSALLAVQIAHTTLPLLQVPEGSATVILLSRVVNVAYRVVEWVSPYVFLTRGIDAAQMGALRDCAAVLVGSILYTSVALVLATLVLRRRGFSR